MTAPTISNIESYNINMERIIIMGGLRGLNAYVGLF
jgi:hypothetical protein